MKKTVIKYGLLSGLVFALMVITMAYIIGDTTDFKKGDSIGYIFMIVAFSMIYFGIRELRDKYSDGVITFNRAFRTGLLITIIGSVIYVITWMFYFNFIDNTFSERYSAFYIENVQESGKNAEEIQKEITAFNENMASYDNPVIVAMYTLLAVFPMGLFISILCAALMKRESAS